MARRWREWASGEEVEGGGQWQGGGGSGPVGRRWKEWVSGEGREGGGREPVARTQREGTSGEEVEGGNQLRRGPVTRYGPYN